MRRLSVFLLTVIAMGWGGQFLCRAETRSLLTRHVREVTLNGQAPSIGQLPAAQSMRLDIVLPLRESGGLGKLPARSLRSFEFLLQHYLTVPEFTARFGPSQEDYDAVIRFATANGFTVVWRLPRWYGSAGQGLGSGHRGGFSCDHGCLPAPPEGRAFYAPDREPTVDLPFQLWHISGLDNYSIPHPMFVKKSDYAKAHGIDPDSIRQATTGSGRRLPS